MSTNALRTGSHNPWLKRLALALILLCTLLLYWPHINDSFLSDDYHYLNGYVHPTGAVNWDSWFAVSVGDLSFHFRPVFGVTGWIIYHLSGLNPVGWHLASLMLHLLNIWLVVLLVKRFVDSDWAALAAGAIFGLHFINTEPVIWMSARSTLLAATFVLAAAVLETAPRKRSWGLKRWAALLMAVLGLLSKENAVVLPLLLFMVPRRPLTLEETVVILKKRPLKRRWKSLRMRAWRFTPYLLLSTVFVLLRFGAIMAGTRSLAYRLELHANILKNLLFVWVGSLFPLDFRSALAAWNAWYLGGHWDILFQWVFTHPGTIIAAAAAVGFWAALLLWGHPAARRLAAWMTLAALPVLFFRGTGARLLYLGIPGAAGALAVLLSSWHRAFVAVWGRVGRRLAPSLAVGLILLNGYWLERGLYDWASASDLAGRIVTAMTAATRDLPPGATVRFEKLPDNVHGAWVFRLGIEDAFALYAERPDVRLVRPGIAGDSERASVPAPIAMRWDGSVFTSILPPLPGDSVKTLTRPGGRTSPR